MRYATNQQRRRLFDGLIVGAARLKAAGCAAIYLDGSFVTGKPKPGDFDACWDPTGVDPAKLDPVFRDFSNGRAAQKAAFNGEFFPSSATEAASGKAFFEFFQVDRFSGGPKGILTIAIAEDTQLIGRST